MRALSLSGPRTASIVEVADPIPGAGEALVRIRACGVCGSDLNAWRGVPGVEYPLLPGAPGHETWGHVLAVGPGADSLRVGQAVTGLLANGFAEMGVARAEDLVSLPGNAMQDAPLLGEPLACAMNVVRRAALQPHTRLVVVGFGYLAALVVQLLPRDIDSWVVVSRREDSRCLALELGAQAVCDFSDVPSDWWDSFPVVIEAAGVQQSLDYATWLTAYGGRLVVAGYHADGPRSVNMQSWNWKGIDVVNAHERQPAVYLRGLRQALEIACARGLELARLQTHAWALSEVAQAFMATENRPTGFIKSVVRP